MKKFLGLVWEALQSLVMKLISFKNLVFAVATYIGVRVLYKVITLATTKTDVVSLFEIWAIYEMVLLVLFYTSNQTQKLIFSRGLPHKTGSNNHEYINEYPEVLQGTEETP